MLSVFLLAVLFIITALVVGKYTRFHVPDNEVHLPHHEPDNS